MGKNLSLIFTGMDFIKIAYCITIPVFLLLIWISRQPLKNNVVNLLAVSNILLIGNSVYLSRQLTGAYQLAKQFSIDYGHFFKLTDGFVMRLLLVIFLPLLSLSNRFRKNQLFTIVLVVLVYWTSPVSSWNTYGLLFKIPGYLCLLCVAYALGWLLNKLPYQSAST